ncbi:MAG: GNAT family N-acetyltransferase [Lachnospiraceae bacterium]|nr:GNAT family N-acetyltransferase [Ruminococcus sp.]MCM1275093.1 GNAT family N-acetyltransferase [Lachnospiraceae bacterium]
MVDMMIYYKDDEITIRGLEPSDVEIFAAEERAQGWDSTPEKLLKRLKDASERRAIALAADFNGQPAGYVSVYPDNTWGAFGGMGYPEIVDFAVLEKYRRRGVGSRLMDAAETVAGSYSDIVYLGVGLHSGYGAAQRMYVKRGYIPDGSGVWYRECVCEPYAECANDDDLVLYLSKKLR